MTKTSILQHPHSHCWAPCTHLLWSGPTGGGEFPLLPWRGRFTGEGVHPLLCSLLCLHLLSFLLVHSHLSALLYRQEVGGQRGGGVAREASIQDELRLLLLFFLFLKVFWQDGAVTKTLTHKDKKVKQFLPNSSEETQQWHSWWESSCEARIRLKLIFIVNLYHMWNLCGTKTAAVNTSFILYPFIYFSIEQRWKKHSDLLLE